MRTAAFSSYGGFWLSFASLYLPDAGIVAAYNGNESELNSALGIYLVTWMVITFLLLYVPPPRPDTPGLSHIHPPLSSIAALRRNMGLIALFFFLTVTFMLLAIAKFQDNAAVGKAGGALGVITALIAYYVGLAELLVRDESWITLPLGVIAKRVD